MHWKDYFFFVEKIGSRYFIVAAIAFLFFYVLLKSKINYKKIQQRFPKQKDYIREIGYSVMYHCYFWICAGAADKESLRGAAHHLL